MAASVELGDSLGTKNWKNCFYRISQTTFFDLKEENNSLDVPVSAKDNFLCANVNTSSLKLVLD